MAENYASYIGNPRSMASPSLNNTIVLIGDSYSALHKQGAAPGVTLPATGYFNWANTKLKKKFQVINYAGVGGETTTQISARFQNDALSLCPGWIMIQGGINDINGNVSSDTTVNNITTMCNLALALGIKVIITTIPIIKAWNGQRTFLNKAHDINNRLKQYARSKSNLILIDWNPLVMDMTTGCVGAAYTYDDTHFSLLGDAIVGDYIASILDPLVPAFDTLPSSVDDIYANNTTSTYTNLVVNPMLTGNVSGLATSWNPNVTIGTGGAGSSSAGSGTLNTDYQQSKVSALDATNGKYRTFEWQQLKALTASGVEKRFAFRPGTSTTVGWSAGDYLYAECEFEADNDWTSGSQMHLALLTLGGSSLPTSYDMFTSGTSNGSHPGSTTPQYVPRSGVLRTYPVQILSGNTSVYPEFRFYAIAGTVRVGRFAIRKATPVVINGITTFTY